MSALTSPVRPCVCVCVFAPAGQHLLMDGPSKLFHRVIMQSNPFSYQYRSMTVANFLGQAVKRGMDCSDLRCMQEEPVQEILEVGVRVWHGLCGAVACLCDGQGLSHPYLWLRSRLGRRACACRCKTACTACRGAWGTSSHGAPWRGAGPSGQPPRRTHVSLSGRGGSTLHGTAPLATAPPRVLRSACTCT
jgi:hypothetical protein